jgi:hypothetical protein
MYRGDIKMIKNTEVKYTAVKQNSSLKFWTPRVQNSIRMSRNALVRLSTSSAKDVEHFQALSTSYYTSTKITSLALTLTEGEED